MKGQKCKALIIGNVWFSIDVILQELPPVGGHVVGQDNDFFLFEYEIIMQLCRNIQGKLVVPQ